MRKVLFIFCLTAVPLATPSEATAQSTAGLEKRIEALIVTLEKTHKANEQRFGNLEDRLERVEKRLDGGYYPPASPPRIAEPTRTVNTSKPSSTELTPSQARMFELVLTAVRPSCSPIEQKAITKAIATIRNGPPYGGLNSEEQDALNRVLARLTE